MNQPGGIGGPWAGLLADPTPWSHHDVLVVDALVHDRAAGICQRRLLPPELRATVAAVWLSARTDPEPMRIIVATLSTGGCRFAPVRSASTVASPDPADRESMVDPLRRMVTRLLAVGPASTSDLLQAVGTSSWRTRRGSALAELLHAVAVRSSEPGYWDVRRDPLRHPPATEILAP